MLALLEWYRYWVETPPMPWPATFAFLAMVGIAIHRIRKHYHTLDRLVMARDGERIVGQALDPLRAKGYRIYHDVPISQANGKKFNIDHAIIGPGGVFVIETKTRAKPERGRVDVHYDGKAIRLNDGVPDESPIIQARANASTLQALIEKATVDRVQVGAVIVYPRWYVKSSTKHDPTRVVVRNEKMLEGFFSNVSEKMLDADTIQRYCARLEEYIEAQERKRRRID